MARSHSLQIGSGRARLEKPFTHPPPQPQVEILCSSQDGPQSKHWAGNSISFCSLGEAQWVPAPLGLTFPHLAAKLLD